MGEKSRDVREKVGMNGRGEVVEWSVVRSGEIAKAEEGRNSAVIIIVFCSIVDQYWKRRE